jgi:hypothetical protein
LATPVGHTLAGLLVARRLGVRSPAGLAAAALAANVPDLDFIPGIVLHGDPYRMHRKLTHTAGFTVTAGMLAGFAGLVSAGSAEGERDLVADALVGAAIMTSHVVLDTTKIPPYQISQRKTRLSRVVRNEIINLTMDVVVFGALTWLLWPRDSDGEAPVG